MPCKGTLWHAVCLDALPDVIAFILLTGKVPMIIEAIRFVPEGIQPGLKSTSILDVDINPEHETLVKVLVEERQKIKQNLNDNDVDAEYHKSRAQAMKILVNAMSYGVFIELNPKDGKTALEVNGKKRTLDFKSPEFTLDRQDSDEMRKKILALFCKEWKDMGFSKGTLHYLKKMVEKGEQIKITSQIMRKMQASNDFTLAMKN